MGVAWLAHASDLAICICRYKREEGKGVFRGCSGMAGCGAHSGVAGMADFQLILELHPAGASRWVNPASCPALGTVAHSPHLTGKFKPSTHWKATAGGKEGSRGRLLRGPQAAAGPYSNPDSKLVVPCKHGMAHTLSLIVAASDSAPTPPLGP